MSASFFIPHFSRSSLRQRRIESDADRSSMPQRRIESNAERCCGRDRCHSGGFLLRIMPPSWRPVPACARHDKLQAGHSPLPQRKLESDAEDRCHNGFCRRAIPHCSSDDAASIPKFGLEVKNRCTKEGVNGEKLTSILKFGPEIKNRCTKEGVNGEKLTSIPKSGPEIKNRCTQEAGNEEILASIRKSGPEIKNRCRK